MSSARLQKRERKGKMPRYNKPTKSNTYSKTETHERGAAWRPDNPAVELLFTAAVTFAGEDTFYESAARREQRIVDAVHATMKRGPVGQALVADVAKQLRQDFLIRTAAILVACEYVAAGGKNGRTVIDSVCQRADEPGEVLAYWHAKHGRNLPRSIKTGLGDAARRLYNEKNAIKYDTPSKAFRFADVLELCHVKPASKLVETVPGPGPLPGERSVWQEQAVGNQSELFKYVLDDRHHGDAQATDGLRTLSQHDFLNKLPEGERRSWLHDNGFEALSKSGFTWEALSSWLPGGMDAEAWEAIIPSMGVMALVRNLRNFDQANISNAAVKTVIDKITDPIEVEKSRIFPYQVLLAYQFAQSDNWKRALGDTVDHASGNLPNLDNSLLVIDTSRSMTGTLSSKSQADRVTVAGLQAASIARHSRNCNIVIFGDTNKDITDDLRGRSVLGAAQRVYNLVDSVGSSTFGHTAIKDHFDPDKHERAILFTDDQMHDSMDPSEARRSASYIYGGRGLRPADISHVPEVITFQLGGYGTQSTLGKGRIHVAGFSDAIFNAVAKILQLETTEPTGTTV
jgi:hypothetical protein